MKYCVAKYVNGAFGIATEHGENLEGAIISFHNLCMVHHNAPDVENATISIVDENLDTVENYKEHIHHEPVAEVVETNEEGE